MAKTPRELSADLAIIVCQLAELAKISRKLPPLGIVHLREHLRTGEPYISCHIFSGSIDPNSVDTTVHERQIDAVRAWACAFGSDLNLSDPRSYAGTEVCRELSTMGALCNGLAVEVFTLLTYDPDAPEYHGKPAAAAIAAA